MVEGVREKQTSYTASNISMFLIPIESYDNLKNWKEHLL